MNNFFKKIFFLFLIFVTSSIYCPIDWVGVKNDAFKIATILTGKCCLLDRAKYQTINTDNTKQPDSDDEYDIINHEDTN